MPFRLLGQIVFLRFRQVGVLVLVRLVRHGRSLAKGFGLKHGFYSKKIDPEFRRAAFSYAHQVQRCTDPKHKSYKTYGARGLRVEYSLEEFVDWWMKNVKSKQWRVPVCGRIDHSKGYSLENIEMQEQSDNGKEVFQRVGKPPSYQRKVVLLDSNGNEAIIFESIKSAQECLKISNVGRICKGERKQENGFVFRYYDGGDSLPS